MTQAYRVPVSEADRIRAGLALHVVATATGAPADMMATGRVSPRASRARWIAMYLAHISFGWPLERVGHAFGMNRATVANACRWTEDARDRPVLDALLERLEVVLRTASDAPRPEVLA